MILVTGGTGLVGSHLLYHLTLNNDEIIAIYRSEIKIDLVKKVFSFYINSVEKYFSKIKWVKADITDISSLEKVFKNNKITKVYHSAGIISFNKKDKNKLHKINTEGTKNIVNFCIDYAIKKLCYVSSIATLSENKKETTITEKNQWNNELNNSEYAISKHNAEMEVWRASQEGLKIVIVNPAVILGYGFSKGSNKLFVQIKKGIPFYTEGITGFISVKDVVIPMILLMESKIINERFVLVSENKSFKEIFDCIANAQNAKKPNIKITKLITDFFWRLEKLRSFLFQIEPIITKETAKSAHEKNYYSSQKIKEILNIKFEKITTVIDTVCKNKNIDN